MSLLFATRRPLVDVLRSPVVVPHLLPVSSMYLFRLVRHIFCTSILLHHRLFHLGQVRFLTWRFESLCIAPILSLSNMKIVFEMCKDSIASNNNDDWDNNG